MNTLIQWVMARASERTTWLGLLAMATSAGFHFSPDLQAQLSNVALVIVGLFAVILKEKTVTPTA